MLDCCVVLHTRGFGWSSVSHVDTDCYPYLSSCPRFAHSDNGWAMVVGYGEYRLPCWPNVPVRVERLLNRCCKYIIRARRGLRVLAMQRIWISARERVELIDVGCWVFSGLVLQGRCDLTRLVDLATVSNAHQSTTRIGLSRLCYLELTRVLVAPI